MEKFGHETLISNIEYHQEAIIECKNNLRDKKYLNKKAVLWELNELEHYYPMYGYTSGDSISYSVNQKITPDTFDKLFADIEEILEVNGYQPLTEDDVYPYYKEKDYYFYIKGKGDFIKFKINSGVCSKIKTGKMVAEEITDCNFIINQ